MDGFRNKGMSGLLRGCRFVDKRKGSSTDGIMQIVISGIVNILRLVI